MKNKLNPFHVLNDNLLKMMRIEKEIPKVSYNGNTLSLEKVSDQTDRYRMMDNKAQWHPDKNELHLRHSFRIHNCMCLFGDRGITNDTSELGIGVMWINEESDQRGMIPLDVTITGATITCKAELDHVFQKQSLRGILSISYVIYLKKFVPSLTRGNDFFMCHDAGTVLGVLFNYEIVIDGNGSIFPVLEDNSSNDALWWIETDWADVSEDRFCKDNFRLVLNKNHHDYPFLLECDGALMFEIMASTIQLFLECVYEDSNSRIKDFMDNKKVDVTEESIDSVAMYYVDCIGLSNADFADRVSLSRNIHRWVCAR